MQITSSVQKKETPFKRATPLIHPPLGGNSLWNESYTYKSKLSKKQRKYLNDKATDKDHIEIFSCPQMKTVKSNYYRTRNPRYFQALFEAINFFVEKFPQHAERNDKFLIEFLSKAVNIGELLLNPKIREKIETILNPDNIKKKSNEWFGAMAGIASTDVSFLFSPIPAPKETGKTVFDDLMSHDEIFNYGGILQLEGGKSFLSDPDIYSFVKKIQEKEAQITTDDPDIIRMNDILFDWNRFRLPISEFDNKEPSPSMQIHIDFVKKLIKHFAENGTEGIHPEFMETYRILGDCVFMKAIGISDEDIFGKHLKETDKQRDVVLREAYSKMRRPPYLVFSTGAKAMDNFPSVSLSNPQTTRFEISKPLKEYLKHPSQNKETPVYSFREIFPLGKSKFKKAGGRSIVAIEGANNLKDVANVKSGTIGSICIKVEKQKTAEDYPSRIREVMIMNIREGLGLTAIPGGFAILVRIKDFPEHILNLLEEDAKKGNYSIPREKNSTGLLTTLYSWTEDMHQYIGDTEKSFEDVQEGLKRCGRDVIRAAQHGLFDTQPAPLYHNEGRHRGFNLFWEDVVEASSVRWGSGSVHRWMEVLADAANCRLFGQMDPKGWRSLDEIRRMGGAVRLLTKVHTVLPTEYESLTDHEKDAINQRTFLATSIFTHIMSATALWVRRYDKDLPEAYDFKNKKNFIKLSELVIPYCIEICKEAGICHDEASLRQNCIERGIDLDNMIAQLCVYGGKGHINAINRNKTHKFASIISNGDYFKPIVNHDVDMQSLKRLNRWHPEGGGYVENYTEIPTDSRSFGGPNEYFPAPDLIKFLRFFTDEFQSSQHQQGEAHQRNIQRLSENIKAVTENLKL